MKPLLKICGITNLIDAKNAINLGADYIGLIHIEASPRFVSIEEMREIVAPLSPSEKDKLVLLTELKTADAIIGLASSFAIKNLQVYSKLSSYDLSTIKSLGYKIFKPVSISTIEDLDEISEHKSYADLIILDTKSSDTATLGGTGKTFNWELYSRAMKSYKVNIALAGGLNPENIFEALKATNAYLVDASSGLESEPRIKSLKKIKAFVAELNRYSQLSENLVQ